MNKTLTTILLFSLVACASAKNPSTPNITFSPLQSAYASYDNEIKKARPSLAFDDATTASNCTDYFLARKAANILESSANFLVAQEYLICDTLTAIKNATPINKVSTSKNVKATTGVQLANKVDLRTFRSSLYRRADKQMYTLATIIGKERLTTEQYAAINDNSDWFYELRVVARLDLNNNGKEDWLIWLTDKAKTGSYNILTGLVAYDVNHKGANIELKPLRP